MNLISSSRIHITEETLKDLGNDYQVEEGKGGERHPYLREHNIQSYLVIPPNDMHEVRSFEADLSPLTTNFTSTTYLGSQTDPNFN